MKVSLAYGHGRFSISLNGLQWLWRARWRDRRNRTLISVRGAIAEVHLRRVLIRLKEEGIISEYEEFDRDGHRDFAVVYQANRFLIECKNAEKEKPRKTPGASPITVDFQRTRNQQRGPQYRFYAPDEFHVLAACLWNRTGRWEFVYIATKAEVDPKIRTGG